MVLRRSVAILIVAFALVALSSPQPEAAAPRIIMLHGASLSKPVFLTDWADNQRFMTAISQSAGLTDGELAKRTYFGVALFWYGPRWEPYVREGRLEELEPGMAEQRGRFYPPHGTSRPLFILHDPGGFFGPTRRDVSPDGVEILARAGIPVGTVP